MIQKVLTHCLLFCSEEVLVYCYINCRLFTTKFSSCSFIELVANNKHTVGKNENIMKPDFKTKSQLWKYFGF